MFRIHDKTKVKKIVYNDGESKDGEERKDGDSVRRVPQQSVSGMVIRKTSSFSTDMH